MSGKQPTEEPDVVKGVAVNVPDTYLVFRPRPPQVARRKFDRKQAHDLIESGLSYQEVGKKFGVTAAAIYRGLHWARDASNPKHRTQASN